MDVRPTQERMDAEGASVYERIGGDEGIAKPRRHGAVERSSIHVDVKERDECGELFQTAAKPGRGTRHAS